MDEDVYFKKEIVLKHAGEILRFRVSQDLFSSFQIDIGTRFLLRTVALKSHSFQKILDLGCGYGPIGLTLKKLSNNSEVQMVDRDALAVEYTRQNAELNRLENIKAYGSIGYDDVPDTDFDLIIANIPGKAGENVITHLLRDAEYFLKPEGKVAVVVVAPLESMVREILETTPDIDITFHQNRSGHAVFHYRFSGGAGGTYNKAVDRGIYDRNDREFQHGKLRYRMQTAHGLPEFDTLHYQTELLFGGLESTRGASIKRAIVFNPGQGHVPVVMWKLLKPEKLILIDRDLLSLRYSWKNLVLNGCPEDTICMFHQTGIADTEKEPVDFITGVLREEEGTEAVSSLIGQAAGLLSSGGTIVLAAGSTAITRLVNFTQSERLLKVKERIKKRGYSLLVLESG